MLELLEALIYPDLCLACAANPRPRGGSWCLRCEYILRPTNYHTFQENPAFARFWGRVDLQAAATLFVFTKKGRLQELLHQLKYGNKPEIGRAFGRWYGGMLAETPIYNTVDLIVPVPLHPQKLFVRGYNQAGVFAEGLAEVMGCGLSEQDFVRSLHTETQTKKSRAERFENVRAAFEVRQPQNLVNKHILLVDDVLTTGATLEACALQLLAVEGVRVSVACIAMASTF